MAKFYKGVWTNPSTDFANGPDSVEIMVNRLARAGFDLIIPLVKSGNGYLNYPGKIEKVSPQFQKWDPLSLIIQKAKDVGIKVHPWMCVFKESENSTIIQKNKTLRMLNREGKPTPWACPVSEEVQEYELSLYKEVMDNYDVDGVHMDYIRYDSEDVCFCKRCRSKFEKEAGVDPLKIGKSSHYLNRKHPFWAQWIEWRAKWITKFVEKLSKLTKSKNKELSAAVFMEYPECIIYEGQDWVNWAERKLIDYAFPMTYTNSTLMVRRRTRNHFAQVKSSCSIWEGLGKESSRSSLTTRGLIEQAKICREEGAEGVVLFSYSALTDEDFSALSKLG